MWVCVEKDKVCTGQMHLRTSYLRHHVWLFCHSFYYLLPTVNSDGSNQRRESKEEKSSVLSFLPTLASSLQVLFQKIIVMELRTFWSIIEIADLDFRIGWAKRSRKKRPWAMRITTRFITSWQIFLFDIFWRMTRDGNDDESTQWSDSEAFTTLLILP